jgi:hypothetical protein
VVDPAVDGVAVLLSNRFSGTFVHASIPGGAGWTRSPRGGWVYRDPQSTVDGVTYVSVKPAAAPERLLLVVEGRHGDYARSTDIRPVHVAIALAASSADREQCGETYLALSRCTFSRSGRTLHTAPATAPVRLPRAQRARPLRRAKRSRGAGDVLHHARNPLLRCVRRSSRVHAVGRGPVPDDQRRLRLHRRHHEPGVDNLLRLLERPSVGPAEPRLFLAIDRGRSASRVRSRGAPRVL